MCFGTTQHFKLETSSLRHAYMYAMTAAANGKSANSDLPPPTHQYVSLNFMRSDFAHKPLQHGVSGIANHFRADNP